MRGYLQHALGNEELETVRDIRGCTAGCWTLCLPRWCASATCRLPRWIGLNYTERHVQSYLMISQARVTQVKHASSDEQRTPFPGSNPAIRRWPERSIPNAIEGSDEVWMSSQVGIQRKIPVIVHPHCRHDGIKWAGIGL